MSIKTFLRVDDKMVEALHVVAHKPVNIRFTNNRDDSKHWTYVAIDAQAFENNHFLSLTKEEHPEAFSFHLGLVLMGVSLSTYSKLSKDAKLKFSQFLGVLETPESGLVEVTTGIWKKSNGGYIYINQKPEFDLEAEILADLAKIDLYYDYSDSLSVFKAGERREEEVKNKFLTNGGDISRYWELRRQVTNGHK